MKIQDFKTLTLFEQEILVLLERILKELRTGAEE